MKRENKRKRESELHPHAAFSALLFLLFLADVLLHRRGVERSAEVWESIVDPKVIEVHAEVIIHVTSHTNLILFEFFIITRDNKGESRTLAHGLVLLPQGLHEVAPSEVSADLAAAHATGAVHLEGITDHLAVLELGMGVHSG